MGGRFPRNCGCKGARVGKACLDLLNTAKKLLRHAAAAAAAAGGGGGEIDARQVHWTRSRWGVPWPSSRARKQSVICLVNSLQEYLCMVPCTLPRAMYIVSVGFPLLPASTSTSTLQTKSELEPAHPSDALRLMSRPSEVRLCFAGGEDGRFGGVRRHTHYRLAQVRLKCLPFVSRQADMLEKYPQHRTCNVSRTLHNTRSNNFARRK